MHSCLKCSEDKWSNDRRDQCIPRSIEFLSYNEPLGLSLAISSISLSAVATSVLVIFIKNRHTPIVKANNQNLSYTILIFLSLSFLSPLLLIGRPTEISCLLRQVTFGNIFTVAVSCILAKTVIVVLAFTAVKPDGNIRKWFGKHVSSSLVIICSLVQVLICVVWMIYSPPFPENNTLVEVGKIILQCNEGSVTVFYLVIGYMGFLSFFCFVVAFLARKLPDTFNEAQYITFSMLVFCSVWISFIPAYLSSKGKYMVAVEIFAILASSIGLLGCIFIPKCYIILIRPELNVRVNLKKDRQGK
ncbi:vomeronasal type-2 receptor 26-like [Discoglossus pictus]